MPGRVPPSLLAALFAFALSSAAGAGDWRGLRGPNHDGSAGRDSRFASGAGAPVLRWRAPLGSGYSAVAVAGDRAVTLFADDKSDLLAGFDASTGKESWRIVMGPRYDGIAGSFDGPVATPAIAEGRVFALDPAGNLVAADLADGHELWRVDLTARENAPRPEHGFATSPLVAAGVLIVQTGAKGGAIAGFDPATGARRWTAAEDAVQYQSPVPVRVGAREIVVAVADAKIVGLDPATGRLLFEHAHGGEPVWIATASAVPVPVGDGRVFVKTHVDNSTMYRLVESPDGAIRIETLWKAPVLRQTYGIPVYHQGYLYGMNGRTVFTCVDAATGELKWRTREPGDGWPTLVGDQIVFVTKERTLHVGPASPEGWKERARLDLFADMSWTAPSVAGDSVYARSHGEMVRVDWKAEADTGVSSRPAVASPMLARFLDEIGRAPDKSAAVDAFLARAKDGPLFDPPDRVVFLYRGAGNDVGFVSDLIGIRREDPLTRVPGTDLFYYEATVEPGSRISYQFVPDFGKAGPDPRNPRRVPGASPGEEASSLAMPGWAEPAHLVEAPAVRRGRLETVEFASTLRPGAKTTLQVYVPAGYEGGDRRFPVAYLIDGGGAIEAGLVPRSLDNLMPERVAPALVVFRGRMKWGTWKPSTPPEAWAAATDVLVKEIVPFVDARFRTIAKPESRAVIGQDFEALDAIGAAFAEPGVFGAVGVQSAMLLDVAEAAIKPIVRTSAERPLRVYHDWSRYGLASTRESRDLREANRRFSEFLRAKGFEPAGGEAKDGEGWAGWRNRTDQMFGALFPPARR